MPETSNKADRTALQRQARAALARYLDSLVARQKVGSYPTYREHRINPILKDIREGSRELHAEFVAACADAALSALAAQGDRSSENFHPNDPLKDRRDHASRPITDYLKRDLPFTQDQVDLLLEGRESEVLGWASSGRLLRIVERSLAGRPPTGKTRKLLQRWSRRFTVGYLDRKHEGSLRARLERLLEAAPTRAKPPPRAAPVLLTDPDAAWAALRAASREARQRTLASLEFRMPAIDPAALTHGTVRNRIGRLAAVLHGFDYHGHVARFVLDMPGFARYRQLAPEFSAALTTIFESIVGDFGSEIAAEACNHTVVNEATGLGGSIARFERGLLTNHAATEVIEALDLAGRVGPLLRDAFRERLALDNSMTDCPIWGRHIEALEEEARGPQPDILWPGDAWSNAALADLKAMPQVTRARWVELLKHCHELKASKPAGRWLKRAGELLDNTGRAPTSRISRWFALVGRVGTRTQNVYAWPPDRTYLLDVNARTLKGLVWAAAARPSPAIAPALADLAVACEKTVLRLGPRSSLVRNACIQALGSLPTKAAAPQLGRLDQAIRYRAGRRLGDRAIDAAAKRSGVDREDLLESSVPTYGLANGAAEPPPQRAKEVARMLAAQRLRLERLMISTRSWPLAVWRERFVDHPLITRLASRLLWRAQSRHGSAAFLWRDGRMVGVHGRTRTPDRDATIQPWHPALGTDEVPAWRTLIERLELTQPFKQAHREIYLLTDAERRTGTYSNRFAAHILRAGQFVRLMKERGWSGSPAISFDFAHSDATLSLPAHDLRATFVTLTADENEGDTGRYALLATDRIEFHRLSNGQPLPLAEVPPLLFSEVMRDADLFVGVAGIGNNPQWQDGGPGGTHRDYWWGYSFGDLSITAQSRRELLRRLVPRLRIAGACKVGDKFLTVKGRVRTYKIHLGSGNILMEPNDQYLCIVPGRGDPTTLATGENAVFLPFEGDRTLAIILSKAFILADDDQITDPSIARQIRQ